jgi:hypothetical protein
VRPLFFKVTAATLLARAIAARAAATDNGRSDLNATMMAAGFWLAAGFAIQACGGGADAETNDSPEPSASSPTSAASSAGPAGSGCVAASCPALQLFGNEAPGCCQATGECGGNIVYMGAPYCAPPNIEEVAAQITAPFEQLEEEEIVTADECPGMTFQGAMIPGCCDSTGVCGVSTATFAAGGSGSGGFDIPVTCISAAEARAIGLAPQAADAERAPTACTGQAN